MNQQNNIVEEAVLKFSNANAKLTKLYKVPELKKYLVPKKKVYSFDLLSGHTCKGAAKECLGMVIETKDGRKMLDGKWQKFRCYSSSQELAFTNVFNFRKKNTDLVLKTIGNGVNALVELFEKSLPLDLGILRWHSSGDAPTANYFKSMLEIIKNHKDILFYGYTKKLKFWIDNKSEIDKLQNFCLTASRGGWLDNLIDEYKLRECKVVFSQYEAKKLKLAIDTDDSHASRPSMKNKSYALLLHGVQKKDTLASKAWNRIKSTHGGYSRKLMNKKI